MKLCEKSLRDDAAWSAAEIALPGFDRSAIARNTARAPRWVHFGAGNLFRAFPAALQQKLLDLGEAETGILVAEGFDGEIIERAYRPYDNLSLLVLLKADGSLDKRVIASVTESRLASMAHPEDWARLCEVFRQESLQMASFTITEKGYAFSEAGSILDGVTRLLYERYCGGGAPLALVSLDNCSHNGERLREAVLSAAARLIGEGACRGEFLRYLQNRVSFPWSMIDKITPRPDQTVQTLLTNLGFADTELIVTKKGAYTAPFVNAEEAEYLVVEDDFPNGRPPLERVGVWFTDRDTVNRVEKMKVCTCLNPLHTALAVFGCLLGYTSISAEMHDSALKKLVETLGYREGLPVVVHPGIMEPAAFLREVLEKRLPNPFLPDSPQRIATDTSQKIPVRFGETLKAWGNRPDWNPEALRALPLVLAGWLRYLLGVDDEGNSFSPSPDPRLAELRAGLAGIHPGGLPLGEAQTQKLRELLRDSTLFGVNLEEIGLSRRVEDLLAAMLAGPGAVRRTVEAVLELRR